MKTLESPSATEARPDQGSADESSKPGRRCHRPESADGELRHHCRQGACGLFFWCGRKGARQ